MLLARLGTTSMLDNPPLIDMHGSKHMHMLQVIQLLLRYLSIERLRELRQLQL